MKLGKVRISAAISGLALVTLFLTYQSVSAGPITNGPGVAPFVKLGVYQGVISVVPGGATDSILEIGNAGRDIASTGSLYLRPGTIGGQGGNVVISAQSTPDEGAEISLLGAGAYQTWNVDLWRNRLRVHTAGAERLIIDGTAGNIYVPTGQICYGAVGSTNCLTVAGGPGVTPNLDAVLGAGNNTTRSAALGAAVAPLSKLVVNNALSLTGNAADGISAYANTAGSAVYAQQNNAAGYAGYFSGRVNITGNLIYKGRLKPTPGLQVCEDATDTCLGQYLYSSGTTRDDGASGIRYHYDNGTAIASVLVYVGTPSPTCPAGWTLIQRGIGVHESLYASAGCGGTEYVTPGNHPYGNPLDPQVCRQNTSVSRTIVTYRSTFTGGTCSSTNSTQNVQTISATTPGTSYSPRYELR